MALENGLAASLEEFHILSSKFYQEGAFLKCISLHEKAIRLNAQLYGADSHQVMNERLDIADCYNRLVLQVLHGSGEAANKAGKPTACDTDALKRYMKMAEILTEAEPNMVELRRLEVRSVCLNNLMCLAKREGNLRRAQAYAKKALQMHFKHRMLEEVVESYLNLAALDSAMGHHELALENAYAALDAVLELEEQRSRVDSNLFDTLADMLPHNKIYFAPLQVMCYINIGAELEYLEQYTECVDTFETAYQLSYMALGSDHPLTTRCQTNFTKAYRKKASWSAEVVDKASHKVVVRPTDTLHQLTMLHNSAIRRRLTFKG